MKVSDSMTVVDAATIRRIAVSAQCLADAHEGSLESLVRDTGFVRTLGGVEAYLALRARHPGMTRSELDTAVVDRKLQVLPSVRACIYLVPSNLANLSLRFSELLSRRRNERDADKAGIQSGEIEQVSTAVLETLQETGPVTTQALRKALPEGTIRSLGDAGKKVGISSTLPPTLRFLEWAVRIERRLDGGRIDTERYLWAIASDSKSSEDLASANLEDLAPRLAEIFVRAAGAGTLDGFAAWSGLGKRAARAALAAAPVVSVVLEGSGDIYWMLSDRFQEDCEDRGGERAISLLPFEDNLLALQGGFASWVEGKFHHLDVPSWGRAKPTTMGQARHASFRSILVGDRIVGFWEFDPNRGEIEIACFSRVSSADREVVDIKAADTARFLREEIGHAKSFSLDNDKALAKRCAQIRSLAIA